MLLTAQAPLCFLVIEDSASDLELTVAMLADEFPLSHVGVSRSLRDAAQLLIENTYDLVLADLSLPDADGCMVVKTARSAAPEAALVVVTGRDDEKMALWALSEGAQDYVVKGEHNSARLAATLLRALQRSRAERLTQDLLVEALKNESKSTARLRELNRAKDDFVATASHELRTPLTSISGYAEMLQDEPGLTGTQRGFVDAIARNAARLQALTHDLLFVSGSEPHEVHTDMAEVDLRRVVGGAQEVAVALASGMGLDLRFEVADVPAAVLGDASQLERVVLNLVSNAIKFSERGGTVECTLRVDPGQVLLEVRDTGVGIPPDEREALFERYFRGAVAQQRAVQGAGLGLHIVATIVARHGGRVEVESTVGEGTTFRVILPDLSSAGRAQVAVPAHPEPSTRAAATHGRRRRGATTP